MTEDGKNSQMIQRGRSTVTRQLEIRGSNPICVQKQTKRTLLCKVRRCLLGKPPHKRLNNEATRQWRHHHTHRPTQLVLAFLYTPTSAFLYLPHNCFPPDHIKRQLGQSQTLHTLWYTQNRLKEIHTWESDCLQSGRFRIWNCTTPKLDFDSWLAATSVYPSHALNKSSRYKYTLETHNFKSQMSQQAWSKWRHHNTPSQSRPLK